MLALLGDGKAIQEVPADVKKASCHHSLCAAFGVDGSQRTTSNAKQQSQERCPRQAIAAKLDKTSEMPPMLEPKWVLHTFLSRRVSPCHHSCPWLSHGITERQATW
eukprot:4976473-Amphidinium_carterae.1